MRKLNVITFMAASAAVAFLPSGPLRGQASGEVFGIREVIRLANDPNIHDAAAAPAPANCTLNAILANLSSGEEASVRKDLATLREQYEMAGAKLSKAAGLKESQAPLKNWKAQGNEFDGQKLSTKADVLRFMSEKSLDSTKTVANLLGGQPAVAQLEHLINNANDLSRLTIILYDLPQQQAAR